jgi:hypothetical protein
MRRSSDAPVAELQPTLTAGATSPHLNCLQQRRMCDWEALLESLRFCEMVVSCVLRA